MNKQTMPLPDDQRARVLEHLPFVEHLARQVAATLPHSVDVHDLVQDGVIGLIDALSRFDKGRGIKFKTFAERRIRGAMVDALRKDAWPRGVRKQRRELEAAREELHRELGEEPSLADLAHRVGTTEAILNRRILRINTIEATSPLTVDENSGQSLPAVLLPSEPEQPDTLYERVENASRVRRALATLPRRELKVIGLYYYGEWTMKEIGAEIGVNESRVSQLHAGAVRRLREAFGVQSRDKTLVKLQVVARRPPKVAEGLTAQPLRLTLAPMHLVQAKNLSPLPASRPLLPRSVQDAGEFRLHLG